MKINQFPIWKIKPYVSHSFSKTEIAIFSSNRKSFAVKNRNMKSFNSVIDSF